MTNLARVLFAFLLLAAGPSWAVNCLPHQTLTNSDIDRFLKSGSISTVNAGTTGVFFVTYQGRKIVVKAEPSANPGSLFARLILKELGVDHDRVVHHTTVQRVVKASLNKLNSMVAQGRWATPDQALRNRVQQKLQAASHPGGTAQIVVSEYLIPAIAGASSLADALANLPKNTFQDAATRDTDVAAWLKGFRQTLTVLESDAAASFFGRTYIADAFLGNEDRVIKQRPNLANVMIVTGGNGELCLAAIDNDAAAPTADFFVLDAQFAALPDPGSVSQAGTQTVPKTTISGDEYLRKTLWSYMPSDRGNFVAGPGEAFFGTFLPDVSRQCGPASRMSDWSPAFRAAAIHIRQNLIEQVKLSAESFIAALKSPMSEAVIEFRYWGLDTNEAAASKLAPAAGPLCKIEIKMRYKAQGAIKTITKRLDLSNFDATFITRAKIALDKIANMKDNQIKKLIGSAISGGTEMTLSPTAFAARRNFMKTVVENSTLDYTHAAARVQQGMHGTFREDKVYARNNTSFVIGSDGLWQRR